MIITTKGIVISNIKYGDTSVIAKIYTENYGLLSFIIKGVRKANSKNKTGYIEHLSIIEIVAYKKNNHHELHLVKGIKCINVFSSIPYDIEKSSIALFVSEIIYRSMKSDEKNVALFDFLYRFITKFDEEKENCANYHLLFLITFSKFLGFFPLNNYSEKYKIFNLNEGCFQEKPTDDAVCISYPQTKILSDLINIDIENIKKLKININDRRELLEKIIQYYQLHVDGFEKVNSLSILREVLA